VKAYYHARAAEDDDWWLGRGLFADRDRPGWDEELARLVAVLAALPPARTLDPACGTGFLTRHLRGEIVGLDQSDAMVEIAGARSPAASSASATRSSSRSTTARSSACSRASSTAISRSPSASGSSPRRGGSQRSSSSSGASVSGRRDGRSAC
jgi:methyltransferase family protein